MNENPEWYARELLYQADRLTETSPHQARAVYKTGRVFAEQAQNPCLIAEYEYGEGRLLLHYLNDYQESVHHHIRALVEIRKPQYANCLASTLVYVQSVISYLYYDPSGYEQQIRETTALLDTMTENVDTDIWAIVEGTRAYLEVMIQAWDQALIVAHRYLQRCQIADTGYRMLNAHAFLAEVHGRRGEWDKMIDHAEQGLEYLNTGMRLNPTWEMEIHAWLALGARIREDQQRADQHARQALSILARIESLPLRPFYDALSWYYERGSEWEAALKLRDRQLSEAFTGKSPFIVTECYLGRIRIQKAIGVLDRNEISAIREWAGKLLNPQSVFTRLEEILGDEF
ncbi:MAG: hypothetical protein MUF87_10165 [Anaerolineae bacterium]|jgi:uncharacterized protein YfbU (UPF0304 family)|nr:hypothetical protein [Anaerolineae bacterium]